MIRFVPNILTVGRLVMSVGFLAMILYSPHLAGTSQTRWLDLAFLVFVLAGVTDVVDGAIARKYSVTSKFGRMLDPLVDKILVCGTFICFAIIAEPKVFGLSRVALAVLHWFTVAVLALREAYVTTLRHIAEARGISFAATASGKIKMLLQTFAIGTVIIRMAHVRDEPWGDWFVAATYAAMLTVTIISGIRATQRESWKQTEQLGQAQ